MDETAKVLARKIIKRKELDITETELISIFERIISSSYAPTSISNHEQHRKPLDRHVN